MLARQFAASVTSIVADRRRIFPCPFLSKGLASPRSIWRVRRRSRTGGLALADRAVEGGALARRLRRGFEMAYNLKDCVELRWGAPDKSDEASTCKRHAPRAQREDDRVPRVVTRAAPAAPCLAVGACRTRSRGSFGGRAAGP